MDVVIPAAGRGSRLGELTADRPKGLVDVAGRPLLTRVFETAVDAGVGPLVVVRGGPDRRAVRRRLRDETITRIAPQRHHQQ
ncbi:NTP transferase domain-containing protein [Halorubrum ezzemoulense]|uniref:NTP transferase domain-containing protein n=1 Tax=Halorubrum ezzemoulense TaxID=337243 RepID=UPI002330E236|nr:NTP transferase domain-containing protein [Halorubrum ezzemoulense]MDB2225912.1 NTP transferase domain-containing protein [Halorubrum ezzemoulense]MDB2259278.1 NTP transferase domain-containing protein [Halorubrum ezzemoulense]MDB2266097.1 NTP transferase domain-containing protein [Halorubrum ezzemoulense]MDB2272452.1 NTP transferase domain-containing protein [Halorubrum ezzemoulense]MDB2276140.1 NTP transferase domain-containing protein [Halorubrum ezzemoulense]